jgi:hypothetical protein
MKPPRKTTKDGPHDSDEDSYDETAGVFTRNQEFGKRAGNQA